jgi:hypothetical protein
MGVECKTSGLLSDSRYPRNRCVEAKEAAHLNVVEPQ